MALCRVVDTSRIELSLPFKFSSAAFSPWPLLKLPSIFFVQSAGDGFGDNSSRGHLNLATSSDASFSGHEGSHGGSGASRPVSDLAQVWWYMT